jgi:hypothetical protein
MKCRSGGWRTGASNTSSDRSGIRRDFERNDVNAALDQAFASAGQIRSLPIRIPDSQQVFHA